MATVANHGIAGLVGEWVQRALSPDTLRWILGGSFIAEGAPALMKLSFDMDKREGWGWYATGPVHGIQLQRGKHAGRLVVPCDHSTDAGGGNAPVGRPAGRRARCS